MPLASTDDLMRATVSSTEWLLATRRTPLAVVAAVGDAVVAAPAGAVAAAPAISAVMQNRRRTGLGSKVAIMARFSCLSGLSGLSLPAAGCGVKSEAVMASMPMTHDLDRPYPIDAEQIRFFRENGFVRLKQVFSAEELHDYGAEITRLTLTRSTQKRPLAERSTYGKAFLQITNLWEESGLARAFVFGKRLARIAAELLEVEGVRLYHDQSLCKEPGGGMTPAHADQFYWPLASDRC